MINEQKQTDFDTLLRSTGRDGVENLITWLHGTDFYRAPASSRFHGAEEGGLLSHSLNVLEEARKLFHVYQEYMEGVPEESVIIAALLHDLCKVNFYTVEKRNRKNEAGVWESYDYYAVKEEFAYGGHGSKSVFLAQRFIKLTPDEAVAINCHMGGFSEDPKSVYNAYDQHPFAWIIHVADEAASNLRETIKEN